MKVIQLTDEELRVRGITELVGNPPIQPESALAHRYLDGLKGVEIGPAAYSPFGLDAIAIAPDDPFEKDFYKNIQLMVCGRYVEMDMYGEADALPLDDNSQDFVVASHVLEHTPNPIACLMEWDRVLRDGGYVFIVVPKREAPYGDEHRVITPLSYFERAWIENWTLEQSAALTPDQSAQPRHRGHYWVFDLKSLYDLVEFYCNLITGLNWKLVESRETDDKDGMGHMVLYRVHKAEV